MGPGLNLNFFLKIVLLVDSIRCVLCLLLKVVSHSDFSVLSMSLMGSQKKFG